MVDVYRMMGDNGCEKVVKFGTYIIYAGPKSKLHSRDMPVGTL